MAKPKNFVRKFVGTSSAKVSANQVSKGLSDGTPSSKSLIGYQFDPNIDYMNADQLKDYKFAKSLGELNDDFVERQFNRELDASNTAHQREVADLKAAGLNPVLSAGGSGASSPSVGSAEAGEGYATARQQMRVQKSMNKYSTDKNYKAQKYATDENVKLQKWATKYNAHISELVSANQLKGALATADATNNMADANRYSANMSFQQAKYVADKNYAGTVYSVDNGQIKFEGKIAGSGVSFSAPANKYQDVLNYLNVHPNASKSEIEKNVGKGSIKSYSRH